MTIATTPPGATPGSTSTTVHRCCRTAGAHAPDCPGYVVTRHVGDFVRIVDDRTGRTRIAYPGPVRQHVDPLTALRIGRELVRAALLVLPEPTVWGDDEAGQAGQPDCGL